MRPISIGSKERVDDWTLANSASGASRSQIGHDALKAPQISDLAANLNHMVQDQRTDFDASLVVPVNKPQETTKLIKAEA